AAFECQGAGKTPPACNGSYPVPAITEQRHIIYSGQDETLTVVEGRSRPLTTEVLKVLHPPWRQHRAKDFSGSVVNKMAPGVRRGTLQTARQPVGDLGRKRIVGRIAVGQECHNVAAVEPGIRESRYKAGRAGEYIGEGRQACQVRRRWRRQERGYEMVVVNLGLPVDPILGQQMDSAGPQIPKLDAPVLSKLALVAAGVSDRIRHFLIWNPGAGDLSSRYRVGHGRQRRQDPAIGEEVRSLGRERWDIDSLLGLRRVRQYVDIVEYHVVGHRESRAKRASVVRAEQGVQQPGLVIGRVGQAEPGRKVPLL